MDNGTNLTNETARTRSTEMARTMTRCTVHRQPEQEGYDQDPRVKPWAGVLIVGPRSGEQIVGPRSGIMT